MHPDMLSGIAALTMIILTVVAKTAAMRLTSRAKTRYHWLELKQQQLGTKLVALHGQNELLARDRIRSEQDKIHLKRRVETLRAQIEAFEDQTDRRNRRVASRLALEHHLQSHGGGVIMELAR